jgi:branched-chain amino acid transport system substrate-binding protein
VKRDRHLARGLRAALLAGALSAGLVACGGNDSDSGGSSSSSGDGKQEITVGLSAAFSGDVAFYGQHAKRGIEYAIEELKESHPDLSVKLVTADDGCAPDGGAAAYRRLTQVDQVDVVLGSACSSATLAGMPVLQTARTPGMTFSSASPEISERSGVGGNPYSWRMNIDDSIMGDIFASEIAERGARRIALLAPQTEFGQAAAEVYSEALPAAGVEVVSKQFFDTVAGDMRPQLTKVENADADALLTFGAAADCAVLLPQMKEVGLDLPVFSRSVCASDEVLRDLGANRSLADGVIEAAYWAPSPEQERFISGFEQEHGEQPDYNAGLGYNAMLTIAEAVAAAGSADREAINDALAELSFESPIGLIEFDDHHQAHPSLFLLTVEGGRLKPIGTVSTS